MLLRKYNTYTAIVRMLHDEFVLFLEGIMLAPVSRPAMILTYEFRNKNLLPRV